MIWAAPLAWALAVAAALPLVAHLWSRKRPRALAFPTLRFLRAAAPVSRRLQQVQDWPMLLLRLAIVLAICTAAAGPTLTSAWRQRAWHDRLHRVIVVDERVAASAAALIAGERRGAASSVVLADDTIPRMLDDAVADGARAARSMRTEVVFVWDGSTSALTRADVDEIPASVGRRLRTVPASMTADVGTGAASLVIDAMPTDATARQRVQAAGQALRLPDATTELLVRWPTARPVDSQALPRPSAPAATTGVVPLPIRRALDDIAADVRVREAADRSREDGRSLAQGTDGTTGRWLANSAHLSPLLRGWFEAPRRLVIALDAAPTSPLAWWSIVSARESLARLDRRTMTTRWSEGDVVAAQRAAPVPPLGTMPGGLDTRAAWALVLVLLLVEGAWRGRGRTRETEQAPGADAPEATDAA